MPGFTLVEAMVVVSILAVLMALALPSFRDAIDRYRVRRATEDLSAAIYLARAEGIKRGGTVTLAKTVTGVGCDASTKQAWSCGWVVFVDSNQNGTLNSGETVLQHSPVPTGVDVMAFQGTTGPAYFKIDRWGRLNGSGGIGALSFNLQPSREKASIDLTMGLCMSSGGRLRTLRGAEECF